MRATGAVAEQAARCLSSVPDTVTATEMRLLAYIATNGPLATSELASQAQLPAPTVNQLRDALVDRGLVVSSPSPAPEQALHVGLSTMGTRLSADVEARVAHVLDALLTHFASAGGVADFVRESDAFAAAAQADYFF